MLDTLRELVSDLAALLGPLSDVDYGEALFLPPGKGPSILILGGITMLALSLFLSHRASRAGPVRSTATARRDPGLDAASPRRGSDGTDPLTADNPSRPPEVQAALEVAVEVGLDLPRRITARPDQEAIAFQRCPASDRPEGCKGVQDLLDRGLRSREASGRVGSCSCNSEGQAPCVFEIVREEPGS